MKLAITGKGGVGKTTLASLLARSYAAEGRVVLAIDADPDANLGGALGFGADEVANLTPVSEMKDLIEERTGMRPGTTGGMFKLNPRVDDIPERFALRHNGVRLLIMGTVKMGGGGCACPEGVLLKSLVNHLMLGSREVVIMDMEAGIEHMGRATAQAVDAFIVVVEPGRRSVQTAESIKKLALDIGITKCYVVGSKIKNDADREFISVNLPGFEILGYLSLSEKIAEADRRGVSAFDIDPNAVEEANRIKARLEELCKGD
ncbi:MAG: carbon monoxide dehydrogenase accessory protein CooC [Dehalococcoidia bacterium]|nr:carbon monoxide dehydrogenase accessory protein CooC [Dehalococcoidia bacterium]